MKKKFTRILGVGLSLALLTSLMMAFLPASAGTLLLGSDAVTPIAIAGKIGFATSIADMAVNGRTIFLTTGSKTYKSADAGTSWLDLTTATDYPTGGNATIKLLAVAPDNPDVVAMVNTVNRVYYSDDGGTTWADLARPGTTGVVNDIDISLETGGYNYIAVGGTDGTDAELYTREMSMVGSWTARSGTGFRPAEKIAAVKFSPNFDIDKIVAVVSANWTATEEVYFQVLEHESPTYLWNGSISVTGWDGWATGVRLDLAVTANGVGTTLGNIASASIAIYDGYLGGDADERIAFVGVAGATDEGGVSRLYDNSLTAITNWSGSAAIGATYSLAYQDEMLIAGARYDNTVYRCLAALERLPRCERLNTFKMPGGSNKTIVAWSGSKVVAGTSGDDSAFSVSTDDGNAFNDVSWVDYMTMAYAGIGYAGATVTDIAVAPDGSKLYVVAYSKYPAVGDTVEDVSVWLREGPYTWTRVLSLKNQTNLDLILRLAPEDSDVVYLVCRDTGDIWTTTDAGKTRWKADKIKKITAVQDFAVESADVAYAISTSQCTKTTNGGASWSTAQPIKSTSGYSLAVAPNGDVAVGCSSGAYAWSVDGGTTFTLSTYAVGGAYPAPVQVLFDADYASNGIAYFIGMGSTGLNIYRGALTSGIILYSYGPTPVTGYTYYGLAQSDGVVYALSCNGTDTTIYRALNLLAATTSTDALWSSYSASVNCTASPQGLKLSAGPTAWAVKTEAGGSWQYVADPIAIEAPAAVAPEDALAVNVNPASGNAYDVTFTFERYSSVYCDELQLQIGTDEDVAAIIYDGTFTGITTDTVSVVIGANTANAYGQGTQASFMPGTTYYWHVRVSATGPALSPWSDVRSFTVEELDAAIEITVEMPAVEEEEEAPPAVVAVPFGIVSPAAGAADVPLQPTFVWTAVEGATSYEIMASEYNDFTILEWSHTTDQNFYPADEPFAYDTIYYWRVRAAEPEQGAWATGIFTTMAKPVPAEPTVITVTEPAPPAEVVTVEVEKEAAIPNYLLWTIIGVGAVLVVALIVLIVRTRRVA